MNITTIGLDIAKRVFHLACCNKHGKLVRKKMAGMAWAISVNEGEYRPLES